MSFVFELIVLKASGINGLPLYVPSRCRSLMVSMITSTERGQKLLDSKFELFFIFYSFFNDFFVAKY